MTYTWEPEFQLIAYEEFEEFWRWAVRLRSMSVATSLPPGCPVQFKASGDAASLDDCRTLAREAAEQIIDDYHRWRNTLVVENIELSGATP